MRPYIKRTVPVEVYPSPEEIAEALWSMDQHEQAKFLNALALQAGHILVLQLQAITDSEVLTHEGRRLMSLMGDYAQKESK
jgi:hypothetical protein